VNRVACSIHSNCTFLYCLGPQLPYLYNSYSYLSCRKQYVQIASSETDLAVTSCGTPKGSVLGPQFFLLYMNDLVNVSDLANVIVFADDTNLFFESDNLADLETVTNLELNKISN